MTKRDCRIVLMGTPEFAVASLDILVKNKYNVVAVVTNPDKPAGRGQKIQESDVKVYAKQHQLTVLQPESLKDPAFAEQLKTLRPDIQIVVAFKILPDTVWRIPTLGTFNLHASLLPHYRGAAPINHAIMQGETKTGVTTFLIDHNMDTGNILLQQEVPIGMNDDAGTIHDKLMTVGAELVMKTVDGLIAQTLNPIDQETLMGSGQAKKAPKIFRDDCKINWSLPLETIQNFVRGLSPYPCAYTDFKMSDGTVLSLKVYATNIEKTAHQIPAGTIQTDNMTFIKVAVDGGFIHITALQLQGKKRMKVDEFLRGFKNIDQCHVMIE